MDLEKKPSSISSLFKSSDFTIASNNFNNSQAAKIDSISERRIDENAAGLADSSRSASFKSSTNLDKMFQILQQQVLNSPQLQAALHQQLNKSNDKQSNNLNNLNGNVNSVQQQQQQDNQMQLLSEQQQNLLFQHLTSNLAPSPVRNKKQQQQQQLQQQQQDAQLLQNQQFIQQYLTNLVKEQSPQNLSNSNSTNNGLSTNNNNLNKGLAELLDKETLLNRNQLDQSDFLANPQLVLTYLAMSQNRLPNRNSSNPAINNTTNGSISTQDDNHQQQNKRSLKTQDNDYKVALYSNGSCKWPLCDQQISDYSSFVQHLTSEHQLDDRSTAQARIQLEMVQQLESNLKKEEKVLQAMVSHLKNQSDMNPTKNNLLAQNLFSIQNNGLFRSTSKTGLNSPLANLSKSTNLNGNAIIEEDDCQSFGSSPRICNSLPFNTSSGHLTSTSPTSPTNNNRHNNSYSNHSHNSPNSTLTNATNVNNHHSNKILNSINNSSGNDLHNNSFNFNSPLSSNFANLNSNSLQNSSLTNFSLLHSSNNSNNLNNGQTTLTTSSNYSSLVNGSNSVSMCNGNQQSNSSTNTQNNSLTNSQSNQADLSSLHASFLNQHSLNPNSNNKPGPGRRRLSEKQHNNLGFLGLDYPSQMAQNFTDAPKGRRIVERANSDINDDMNKNREYYTNTDVRPPYTYASLIRQVIKNNFFLVFNKNKQF